MADVMTFLRRCRRTLENEIQKLRLTGLENEISSIEKTRQELQKKLIDQKKQLQLLLSQKIRDLSLAPENETLIQETYALLQKERSEKILALEADLQKAETSFSKMCSSTDGSPEPLALLDQLIKKQFLTHKDLTLLIDHIEVHENGDTDFYFRRQQAM